MVQMVVQVLREVLERKEEMEILAHKDIQEPLVGEVLMVKLVLQVEEKEDTLVIRVLLEKEVILDR